MSQTLYADPVQTAARDTAGDVRGRVVLSGPEGAEDAWRLLDASGYLAAWLPASDHFVLRREYVEGCRNAALVNRLLLLRDPGVCGLIQLTAQVSGPWLVHHLCLEPSHRKKPRGSPVSVRTLILSAFDQLLEEGAEAFEIILADKPGTTQSLYVDFHEQGWSPEQSQLWRTHAFRAAAAAIAPFTGPRSETPHETKSMR